jgi:Spx/MgsR family transcriptional regulator
MSMVLYGIANCDTVKRARAWLAARDIEVVFHDFKRAGLPAQRLDRWVDTLGWERLVNRQGTTWRRLDAAVRDAVVDASSASALMCAQPSLVKRPVIEWPDGKLSVGFVPTQWPVGD